MEMDAINISLTLEQIGVIQDALEMQLDAWHDSGPLDTAEAKQEQLITDIFNNIFGPIIRGYHDLPTT